MPDSETPGKTMYETASNGQWMVMADFQHGKNAVEIRDDLGQTIDYSLHGMQSLLNSLNHVGSEVFDFVSKILGVGVNVMIATRSNLTPTSGGIDTEDVKPYTVFIAGNGIHYEVIGVQTDAGIQTVFLPDDPFMIAFRSVAKLRGIHSKLNIARDKLGKYIKNLLIQTGNPDVLAIIGTITALGDPQILHLADTHQIVDDATSNQLRNNFEQVSQLYEQAIKLSDDASDGKNTLPEIQEILDHATVLSDLSIKLTE